MRGWPPAHELLSELMDAAGVYNDGVSSPKVLWERCIAKVTQMLAAEDAVLGRVRNPAARPSRPPDGGSIGSQLFQDGES